MDIELLKKIKNTDSTNEKIRLAVDGFKELEHKYMTYCLNKQVWNISKTNLAKVLNYDINKYGRYEDLGAFLIEHPDGGDDILKNSCAKYDISYLDLFIEQVTRLSGNELLQFVFRKLEQVLPKYRPYYVRVLLKNPRIGLSETNYNKIRIKQGLAPINNFYVKLAKRIEIDEIHTLPTPLMCEIKYDGVRSCVYIENNKVVSIKSRQDQEVIEQFPEVVDKLNKSFSFKDREIDCMLDGEILSSDFESLQKRLGRLKSNINTDYDIDFVCYDIVKYMDNDLTYKKQSFRRQMLETIYDSLPNKEFKLSHLRVYRSYEEITKFYTRAVKNGEEGIMIKTLDSLWAVKKDDRDKWYKVKPVYSNEFVIYDCAYGSGKNKDFINILYIKDKTGFIKTKVSSGISDNTRKQLTQLKENNELIGQIVEVKYNSITSKGSLRHPRFVTLRFDKDQPDDLRKGVRLEK